MKNLADLGRIFYGIAMAGMGFQTVYDKDFPYMLIPPNHSGFPGFTVLTFIFGVLVILAGGMPLFLRKYPGKFPPCLGLCCY